MSHAWMQTYSGVAFPLFNHSPSDVKIIDIAHALSMQCRFNGHLKRFYSVAEHCWLLSHMVSPKAALTALLHDAPEAYIGDMVSPLKDKMPDFGALDQKLMYAIWQQFGADASPEVLDEVHRGDKWIAYQEGRALLLNPELVDHWGPSPAFKPEMYFDLTEAGLPPERAKHLFLTRFEDLIRYKAAA